MLTSVFLPGPPSPMSVPLGRSMPPPSMKSSPKPPTMNHQPLRRIGCRRRRGQNRYGAVIEPVVDQVWPLRTNDGAREESDGGVLHARVVAKVQHLANGVPPELTCRFRPAILATVGLVFLYNCVIARAGEDLSRRPRRHSRCHRHRRRARVRERTAAVTERVVSAPAFEGERGQGYARLVAITERVPRGAADEHLHGCVERVHLGAAVTNVVRGAKASLPS